MEPSKVYLLMTWEDPADGLTLFPLGVAYTEERARAVAETHGRTKAIEEIETGTDEPPVLEWQEPNINGEIHLTEVISALSLVYYRELVAFVDVEPEVRGNPSLLSCESRWTE